MWRRHRTPSVNADAVRAAEQTAEQVRQALETLEGTYEKLREPLMNLEDQYPLLRKNRHA